MDSDRENPLPGQSRDVLAGLLALAGNEISGPTIGGVEPPAAQLIRAGTNLPLDATASLPRVAGYHVLARLGGGGMGDVFHAIQLGTQRDVALKLMRGSFAEQARLRFDREVRITARLDHPNIARVYDSGAYQGCYYYAMELIAGSHLDDHVKANFLDEQQILELFLLICRAVAHAHLRGVIHRDLKPSNILISQDGQPHLVDFGLAKKLMEEQTQAELEQGHLTVDGQLAGTPAFMSPEQAGASNDMDTRTDVYSLGVILYQCLTGAFPHDLKGSLIEVIGRICHEEVRRPRLAKPGINTELESLLLKALARQPDERYPSAGELSRDVENYLRGEPLMARPATTLYFLRKRLWKYRTALSVAAGFIIALVMLGIGVTAKIVQERNLALAADRRSNAKAIEAEGARRVAELRVADGLVDKGNLVGTASGWGEAAPFYQQADDIYKREATWTGPADLGLWNAARFSPSPLFEITGPKGGVADLAMAPDGHLAVTGSQDGSVRTWDLTTGRILRTLSGHQGRVWSAAVSPDSKTAATGGAEGLIKLWDLSPAGSDEPIATFGPVTGWVTAVAFSNDGDNIVSVSGESETSIIAPRDDTICVWHVDVRDSATRPPSVAPTTFTASGRVARLIFAPDGRLATAGVELAIWDLEKKQKTATLGDRAAGTTAGCFSTDGSVLCAGDTEGYIKLWDVKSGQLNLSIKAHTGTVCSVIFLDDGKTVASADENHSLAFHDVATRKVLRFSGGAHRPIRDMAFSRDGRFGLAAGADDTLTLWSLLPPVESIAFSRGTRACDNIAFFPDGKLALLGSRDGLALLDVPTGKILHPAQWPLKPCDSWALSPDGSRMASITGDSLSLFTFSSLATTSVGISRHGRQHLPMAFSPDGHLLLIGAENKSLIGAENNSLSLRDASTGAERHSFPALGAPVNCVAFSPDGKSAISGGRDGVAIIWDVQNASERCRCIGHQDGINAVAFSPDGHSVVTASGNSAMEIGRDDYSVRLWDTATGSAIHTFEGHSSKVRAVAFSPDGSIIASAGDDHRIQLWDVANRRELRSIEGNDSPFQCLAYSPAGMLLSGCADGTANLWDFSATLFRRRQSGGITAAFKTLRQNPADANALNTLGQWYAFVRNWDSAAILLRQAAVAGGRVDSLSLARCEWLTGQYEQATAQFLIAAENKEVSLDYARLCIEAISSAQRGTDSRFSDRQSPR